MNLAKFENALKIGETAAIEFKRAGGTIEMDTFETVCSFSNRLGGDIYLGVQNNAGGSHLWEKLSNRDLLKSAGLSAEDHGTGKNGFNLAAVMLLGRDEVIRDICPAYQTDAPCPQGER